MFSAMTSVNKLPGAFPSVHRRARERPTGSEFLTARTRLRVSDCNEVVANCISWGPRHFPSLLPDCSSSLACFWNRMPVTSEWGPEVASPPPHGAGRGSPNTQAPAPSWAPWCCGEGAGTEAADLLSEGGSTRTARCAPAQQTHRVIKADKSMAKGELKHDSDP